MLLFVGLGNPEPGYQDNRHNVGFMAVDEIIDRHKFPLPRARFQGLVSDGRLGQERVLILKPVTFMNESGRSVGEAARYLKIPPEDIVVFHDELDLSAGKVRVKSGGGHAGHNGLRSIDRHVGKNYRRVRIGIGHPGNKNKVHGHVLHDFSKEEYKWLDPLLAALATASPLLAEGDNSGFMSKVALALQPARSVKATKKAKSATPEDPDNLEDKSTENGE
jgi:PTH1 family peptidyl-tRNA hydrolase